MLKMSGLTFPKWLDRPHIPNETAQQRLASITLHRIALFILIANPLAAIFIPSNGSDSGVRLLGLLIPVLMLLLQRFWSTKAGFVFWYTVTFSLACIEILARGGILSSGFLIIARLILGSSIAFSPTFTAIMGAAWLAGSLGATVAQQFGWWIPQAVYVLTPIGAWWAIAGSTLNFGMRVVVVIDEFRKGQAELREKLSKLVELRAEEEGLIAKRDRLFWYLSHELRSPLTRLKLQIRGARRGADERWSSHVDECGAQVAKLSRLTEQSLLLAQLRGRISFPLDDEIDLMACMGTISARIEERRSGETLNTDRTVRIKSDGLLHIRSSADLLERGMTPLVEMLAEQGSVSIIGRDLGDFVEIELDAAGSGIEDQQLPVSVVRELVRHHGGELAVERSEVRRIRFLLKLKKRVGMMEQESLRFSKDRDRSFPEETVDVPIGFFRYFAMFTAGWGVVWTVYQGLRLGRIGSSLVAAGIAVTISSLAALWVNRSGGARQALPVLYSGTALVIVPTLVYGGGVLNPAIYVAASVLLTSVLIYSKRIVFTAVCTLLMVIGGIAVLEVREMWPSIYEGMDPFGNWMILILSGATFGLVLIPVILKQRTVQSNLEEQEKELSEAHDRNELIRERQIAVFGNIIGALAAPLKHLHDSVQTLPDSFHELKEECVLLENRLRQMRAISEAGRISTDTPHQVELVALIKQVCHDVNFEFSQTRREVVLESGEGKWLIQGDPELLMSAFHNVIHNALRFTAAETVVRVHIESTLLQSVQIIVTDEGPGISDGMLNSIFEPFVRVDERTSGTGLGLAIAKEVVLAHGGEIEARNLEKGGLAVSIRLPLAASDYSA